jgi:DNA-binding XRE family transcriptional regulator
MNVALKQRAGPRSREATARRMRLLRQYSGKTQSEMGVSVGLNKKAWNNYERARSRPPVDVAFKLIDEYQVTFDWIYQGDISRVPYAVAVELQKLGT